MMHAEFSVIQPSTENAFKPAGAKDPIRAIFHAASSTEPPFVAPFPAYDKTTEAVLAFYEAADNEALDNSAIKDAFDHLMAIIFKATANLFLTELGVRSFEETHAFLRAWLLQELLHFSNPDARQEAARTGKFRHLGYQGRNALIDELRRRSRSEDALDRRDKVLPFEPTTGTDEDNALGWDSFLAVDLQQGVASSIGKKPSLEPLALQQKLRELRDEITEELGKPLFAVLSTVCELFPDELSAGEVTRAIANSNAVSEQTARKLHHKLGCSLHMLKDRPSIQALTWIISRAGDPSLINSLSCEPLRQGG